MLGWIGVERLQRGGENLAPLHPQTLGDMGEDGNVSALQLDEVDIDSHGRGSGLLGPLDEEPRHTTLIRLRLGSLPFAGIASSVTHD